MTRLPEDECAFFFAAMATLDSELRPAFVERVANILSACSTLYEPGPGDVDRAIRQALVGLWQPHPDRLTPAATHPSRWNRPALGFDRVKARMNEPK
jgi:hypothetical protein